MVDDSQLRSREVVGMFGMSGGSSLLMLNELCPTGPVRLSECVLCACTRTVRKLNTKYVSTCHSAPSDGLFWLPSAYRVTPADPVLRSSPLAHNLVCVGGSWNVGRSVGRSEGRSGGQAVGRFRDLKRRGPYFLSTRESDLALLLVITPDDMHTVVDATELTV